MGNQFSLLDQGCTQVVDLEGVMAGHEHDGVITQCERARERAIVRAAVIVLEVACWRRRVAEWEGKHLPGTRMPHYLQAGQRDITRLLMELGNPPAPAVTMRLTVRRKGKAPLAGERRTGRDNKSLG